MLKNLLGKTPAMPLPVAIMGILADPPHKGHLKMAETLHNLGYHRVLWMVTPQNPAKPATLTPYHHRAELARLLAGRRDWLEVNDAEAMLTLKGGDLRTHTLLSHYKQLYPDVPFTFVMGSNNWQHFHNWGNYKEMLELASLLIVPRPGSGRLDNTPAGVVLAAKRDTSHEGKPLTDQGVVPQGQWRLHSEFVGGAASSTQIRGENVLESKWLTNDQKEYIKRHLLYR